MEGGQKIDINLESPLDTKSSDMLVSVQDTRFAHNRQKFQGHVLPTSLRYERNGWAAGWYVYDFKIGGGYIFSRNDNSGSVQVPYLAATRSKLNNTPVYVISFKVAKNNDLTDPDAVASAVQFQAWHSLSASVNARECEEASIDMGIQPILSFNYAVENHDYKRRIQFNFDVCSSEEPTFTSLSNDSYGVADLSMDYVDRSPDGTVTAILYNNEVKWEYDEELYIPKDLIDAEGFKFGKFVDVTNEVINWKLGNKLLQFDDAQNKFIFEEVSKDPGDDLDIAYSIPVTYTIPLHKYYSQLNNITWSAQGTRTLFNNESEDEPSNTYRLSTDHIVEHNIAVHNDDLYTVGFDGPDIELVSQLQLPLDDLPSNTGSKTFSTNAAIGSEINYVKEGVPCIIPIFNTTVKDFKLNEDDEAREVMIQVYYKYPGRYVQNIGTIQNRPARAAAMSYKYGAVGAYHEVIYSDNSSVDYDKYVLDGIQTDNMQDGLRIGNKIIWGRKATINLEITAINNTSLSNNNHINISGTGINVNLVFNRQTERNESALVNNTEYSYIVDYQANGASGWYFSSRVEGSTDYIANQNGYGNTFETSPGNKHPLSETTWGLGNDGLLYFSTDRQGTSNIFLRSEDFYYNGSWYSDAYVIPIYKIIDTNPGNTQDFASKYYLCAVHSDYRISADRNFWLTPAYGFIIIRGDAPYCNEGKGDLNTYGANDFANMYAHIDFYDSARVFMTALNEPNQVQSINLNTLLHRDTNSVISFDGGTYQILQIKWTWDPYYSLGMLRLDAPGFRVIDSGINNESGSLPLYWDTVVMASRPVTYDSNARVINMPTLNGLYQYDKNYEDFWLTAVSGSLTITGTDFTNNLCIDIMDLKTGKLLINHSIDNVTLTPASRMQVDLSQEALLKGRVFFNQVVDYNVGWEDEILNTELKDLYTSTIKSGAFFPVSKYRINDAQSIYRGSNGFGGCQGVALFNTVGVTGQLPSNYAMVLLSPLSSYILPPKIDTSKSVAIVYAGKAFTHHIKWHTNTVIQNNHFISDTDTDTGSLTIVPRANIITNESTYIENNNKYYTANTIIMPTSMSYYNKQVHITYKGQSGNTISINDSIYDMSASDLSIRQDADLTTLYLPEHPNEKYHFAIGDHDDVLTVQETKEIINTIADTEKHWASVNISGVDFTAAEPEVTLQFTENHVGREPIEKVISYKGVLEVTSDPNAQNRATLTEYSDDSQLVLSGSVDGEARIVLPDMPEHKFKNSIANNKITVDVEVATGIHNGFIYDYANNSVDKMVIKNKELAKASIDLLDTDNSNQAYNIYHIAIDQSINTNVYFKHYGIYKFAGTTVDGRTPYVSQLEYDPARREFTLHVNDMNVVSGMSAIAASGVYVFNFDDFDDKEKCTPKYLVYSATDIRDPNPATQTKEFARVMADNEYQLIKQHWDSTVATENFWWIDSTHTLKLTKDRFVLEEKALDSTYHPWNGDRWNVVQEFNRTHYLNSESDTYLVSSANGKGARGYLYILEAATETSIKITIYDPLTVDSGEMHVVGTYTIVFNHVALCTKKSHDLLNGTGPNVDGNTITVNTYSDIVANSLLSDSKLTAVNIKGTHWIGIQYDKNFNQWSFALGNTLDVIHGYGIVGLNGYATGGMLPAKYFDSHGFAGEVYNISELEAEKGKTLTSLDEFNIFEERIVGDENQQWYISKELTDIVMAVDLTKRTAITLPLTNVYSQIYSSPSYAKYTVHALGIQIKQLMDMIIGGSDNPIWMDIIKYAMFPIVWYLSPYTNVINYLQQTIGQYAYTHFNSTSISRKSSKLHDEVNTDNAGLSEDSEGSHIDTLISDDLSFDVQHISQEQSFKDNSWDNILGIFASMVVSATDMSMRDIAVNQLQNQSAVNDIGKKFGQAFLQNIGSMSVTGFTMQSTKPMLKSEVTAVKTLDMFYSTSAEQNCFAGPGFVNMQFVAQCTAQSVTSVQLEAQQTQMFMLLRELTTWQGKVVIFLLDTLKEWMFKMSDNMGGGPSAGVVVGLGWIGAVVMSSLGYALVAAKSLVKLGIEVVDSMLNSFFPSGVKTTVTAQLSRHNYDIEGKHAYGNKSEQFFWPCADCNSKLYTDEGVEAVLQEKPWPLEMPTATSGNKQFKPIYQDQPACITTKPAIMESEDWNGEVPYNIAMCKGTQKRRALPDSTAYVIGTESFMPTAPFKNENIGEGEPVFTPSAIQDYIIDKNWNIFVTALAGDALWVSCKDTKLFDGNYSNIVVTDDFCGIAAPHVAVEVKRNICEEYLRPWAVSPDAIALNITGLNCAYEEVAYHAFDGYGYRITDWLGSSGMNKERYTWQYCFQINDRFKRSNKLPPNQFMGNFQALPSMSLDINDKVFNEATVVSEDKGLRVGVTGENKDQYRYALPIFTEQISSLPAIVRALSPYKLAVIEGITSLTTEARISQNVYKIPDSIDFNINDKLYRMTNEYICSVKHSKGVELVEYMVPALGLKYLGATPFMAYFYNQATRQYYIYQGGNTLQVLDMLERFRDIKDSTYDFINQEVVMPCLATFDRLDRKVKDDTDETDNIIIPVFRHNKVGGEITPPIDTIFNTDSWYVTRSIAAGLVFQGPNRCIINRFVWSQYMLDDIKANKGKWKKVPREEYHPFRTYAEKFQDVMIRLDSKLKGWTHNPFLLVTAPLGVNEQTDCKFEWEITFAWTTEMEQLYEQNEYVVVNILAETMAPGGKVFSRPTHIFLTRELFTRSGNVGYYSFRYQSNNGIGNRERLHIWSDGYIAISSLQLEYVPKTEKRNEVLTIQEDVKGMKEM